MVDLARLKICFLAGTLGQGGAERQLYYILKTLKECKASLHLLCLTKGEFWEDRIGALGIPITWVGQSGSRLERLGYILLALHQQRPDIVQSQHLYTNLYATVSARVFGFKDIGALRNDTSHEIRALGFLGQPSLHAPRLIAVNSRRAMTHAIGLGVPRQRLRFLPNVVDANYFKPVIHCQRTLIKLIVIGRLVEQKRLDRFLSTLACLRHQAPLAIKAIIIGKGEQRLQLERQASELGLLPDLVEFRGQVSDVSSVYQTGDILVLTSDWEGTPNVVLEAMASGLPIVATNVGDVPEIVQDGETGYLSNPEDQEAMVEALVRLIGDYQLRSDMGYRARKYIEIHHSLDRLPQFLEDFYETAFSGMG